MRKGRYRQHQWSTPRLRAEVIGVESLPSTVGQPFLPDRSDPNLESQPLARQVMRQVTGNLAPHRPV